MKKLCVSLSIASILLTSGLTFGSWWQPGSETIACPTVKDIQSYGVGITHMDDGEYGERGSYMSMNINNYGTPGLWVFSIINIDAKDRVDAYKQANTALGTLSGNPTMTDTYNAEKTNVLGDLVCYYFVSGKGKNGYPIKAAAILSY